MMYFFSHVSINTMTKRGKPDARSFHEVPPRSRRTILTIWRNRIDLILIINYDQDFLINIF